MPRVGGALYARYRKVSSGRRLGVKRCGTAIEKLAGGLGFEPRFSESESDVLPLDDPPS